ncbi:MAG: hypothetical protein IH916_11865, partial [Acidobacteria bacterium]|nr:hypothetical protein [Acidobacteriota bacterium]
MPTRDVSLQADLCPLKSFGPRARLAARAVAALGLAALLLGLPSLGQAQTPKQVPYFAIQNARLVTVSGEVIENGTIVVANGLIEAVGTNVAIPPEAWVIDGQGLTVYPGLIDSLTTLGLQAAEGEGSEGGQQSQRQRRSRISRGPEDRPATTPWERAADKLNTGDQRLESWRKVGFTAAVTSPDKGTFPGQAALINLAGQRPNQMVVKTPVALRVNLTPPGGFRSFPGSLMGVFAYIKQVFLDAEHYGQAWQIYEAAPRGLERPAYDRSLAPILQAVESGWPVLIPATWAKEIQRALTLGETVKVNTLIYGVHQGYQAAD